MEIRTIKTYKDAKQIWLGLDQEKHRRKVFCAVDQEQLGAKHVAGGLTIFEPGEKNTSHGHPGTEELNFVVSGGGVIIDVATQKETRIARHDFIWIPEGVEHIHYNDTEEQLLLLWIYAPPGTLPIR